MTSDLAPVWFWEDYIPRDSIPIFSCSYLLITLQPFVGLRVRPDTVTAIQCSPGRILYGTYQGGTKTLVLTSNLKSTPAAAIPDKQGIVRQGRLPARVTWVCMRCAVSE